MVVEPVGLVAHFQFQPSVPRVGEDVRFDASASQAPEGEEIVSYEWEFRMGPAVIQARGEQITLVFEEAGTWLVTLRVTDTAGQTAQRESTVTVR